jgi:hypothetical protein
MLSRIDDIIYPNRCEVIEIEASQRYIYPIFKNGSTSIIEYANQQKYHRLINEQIQKIATIDVVLRDPTSRFISGLNTFVSDTKQNNPYLDTDTIIYFAENYLFLNRHYSPQLGWLINIKRYMGTTAKFRLHDMSTLSQFTLLSIKPTKNNLLNTETIERLKTNIHNEMYIRLDNLLLQLIGQELTFKEILAYIKQQDHHAYQKLQCIALD